MSNFEWLKRLCGGVGGDSVLAHFLLFSIHIGVRAAATHIHY